IAARSCYFADHYGIRDNRMINEDIGVQEFTYDIMPYHGDLAAVIRAAEECNTVFPVIPETYHYGSLPQRASHFSADTPDVTLSAVKPAEDGNGIIIRLTEIAGREQDVSAVIFGASVQTHIKPFDIQSFRIADGCVTRVDFTEKAK
ncbi:MAG: glycosyl hydrolase-related protein, partial [Eubacteriales bacterium]